MNARIPPQYMKHGEYDQSAYDEAINKRVEVLMQKGGACDPLDPTNFDEALSETLAVFPGTGLTRVLAVALREGEPVNKQLTSMANTYWLNLATERAKEEHEEERAEALVRNAETRYDIRLLAYELDRLARHA